MLSLNDAADLDCHNLTDSRGIKISEGDIILHGEMYWSVARKGDRLGIVHGLEFEPLEQFWCDCGRIVGSWGCLQEGE